MSGLRIGGLVVDRDEALAHAGTYLSGSGGRAYPSYDGYDAGRAAEPLGSADLLAPTLLNAPISISTYERLQAAAPTLQKSLDLLPVDLDLADAGSDQMDLIGTPSLS